MWISLTTFDVLQEMTAREVEGIAAVKGEERGAALDGILERAIARVRGAVFASGTTLGDEGTIPDSLAGDVVAIARWRLLTSVPKNEALQTEARRAAADAAEERLSLVERGTLKVEPGSGSGSGVAMPSMGERTLNFTRDDQDGL